MEVQKSQINQSYCFNFLKKFLESELETKVIKKNLSKEKSEKFIAFEDLCIIFYLEKSREKEMKIKEISSFLGRDISSIKNREQRLKKKNLKCDIKRLYNCVRKENTLDAKIMFSNPFSIIKYKFFPNKYLIFLYKFLVEFLDKGKIILKYSFINKNLILNKKKEDLFFLYEDLILIIESYEEEESQINWININKIYSIINHESKDLENRFKKFTKKLSFDNYLSISEFIENNDEKIYYTEMEFEEESKKIIFKDFSNDIKIEQFYKIKKKKKLTKRIKIADDESNGKKLYSLKNNISDEKEQEIIEKIKKKYKIDKEEFEKIFEKVSEYLNDLIIFYDEKKSEVLWSENDDEILKLVKNIDEKRFTDLLFQKGFSSVKRRIKFKNIEKKFFF